jgi:hypothetical protein
LDTHPLTETSTRPDFFTFRRLHRRHPFFFSLPIRDWASTVGFNQAMMPLKVTTPAIRVG